MVKSGLRYLTLSSTVRRLMHFARVYFRVRFFARRRMKIIRLML